MAYEVHLDVYDGPFALLLQLITAQQVDLYEVSLASIVDGFLAELARLETLDLELTTEFLLIAATLVELKCRRLLPGSDELDLDEELSLYEARDYLLARLVECKMFAAAAAALASAESVASRAHARLRGPDERFAGIEPDLLAGVSAAQIAEIARRCLEQRPAPVVETTHVHEDEVSVIEVMESLATRLPALGRTTFRTLTEDAVSTAAVVACFLALLELYKREAVDLEQLSTFGELTVTWTGGGAGGEYPVDSYDDGAL